MGKTGWWVVLLVLCGANAGRVLAQGEVYKTVDEQGRVIYTDQRPEGDRPVEQVVLPSTNAIPAPPPEPVGQDKQKPDRNGESKDKAVPYTRFQIISPAANELMDYDVRYARLAVSLRPDLQPGHTIQFYLDGQPLGVPSMALSMDVGDLQRGGHRVEARLRDERGRILDTTPVVEFHIRQHTVLDNPYYDDDLRPPGVRPPGGATSPGGAASPDDIDQEMGAGSPHGARSPGQRLRLAPRQ